MTKNNLEKCKSSNKGITLIALIITIIVLLILAGITISALTGSDSAPAKANEAKQKNDIGTVKDEIAVIAQNAHLEAYDDIYVKNNSVVSSTAANTTVGQRVINAVLKHFGGTERATANANDTLTATTTKGLVTITVSQAKGANATITLATRDFTETGSISYDGGVLTWDGTTTGGNGGGGNPPQVGVTITDAQKETIENAINVGNSPIVTISLGNTKTTEWDVDLFSDGVVMDESEHGDVDYYNTSKKLFNGTTPSGVSSDNTPLKILNDEYYIYSDRGSVYDSIGEEYIDCTINSWKILRINDNNTIDLVPAEVPARTVPLCGAQGYNNAVKLLNDACNALYGNGTTITARSINIEDIEQLIEEANGTSYLTAAKNDWGYGTTKGPYSPSDSIYPTIYGNEMTDSLGLSSQTSYIEREKSKVTPNTGISPTQTHYYINSSDLSTALGKYASLILPGGSPSYWLASRCVADYGDNCNFSVFSVGYGEFYSENVFNSGDTFIGFVNSLFPIVTINSGTLIDGGNGTYSIE